VIRAQLYDDKAGIRLTPDASGLCIVRAIAVAPGKIPSQLFLSKSAALITVFLLLIPPCCRFPGQLSLAIRPLVGGGTMTPAIAGT